VRTILKHFLQFDRIIITKKTKTHATNLTLKLLGCQKWQAIPSMMHKPAPVDPELAAESVNATETSIS
jgi:hypothetical protein